jgi:hypothetical protein
MPKRQSHLGNVGFVPFSVPDTLADIRGAHFPDLAHEVRIYFVGRGPLACVRHEASKADIYVHQLLNHPETPLEVVAHICKHELLHLRIRPVECNGLLVHHPPEFWEAEKALCPERDKSWLWIWTNLEGCLRHRPRLERIDVLLGWRKFWSLPRMDVESCQRLLTRGEASAPEAEKGW